MTIAVLAETGFLTTLAVVLAWAGAAKIRRPEPTRRALVALGAPMTAGLTSVLAATELGLGVLALYVPTSISGVVLAGFFGCLAVAAGLLARRGYDVDCGCFGEEREQPPGPAHVLMNLAAAVGAGVLAFQSPPSLAELVRSDPVAALAALAAACVGAMVWRLMLTGREAPTATDVSDRLVSVSAMFLEEHISRRSALVRISLAATAFCMAPVRYLLYPGSALAVIVPSSCGGGECTDGYTAFCCEINAGLNQCPSGTFPGGWWMCTDYRGRQLCASQGVRYYVDCNALPGRGFPGGCVCANNSCEQRRVNCNIFRYGQCNTHIGGTTAVVCRMVTCQNPGSIPALNCSSSVSVDDAVCAHEAPCLQEPALELAGAGGV
jgi:hypothetical protein